MQSPGSGRCQVFINSWEAERKIMLKPGVLIRFLLVFFCLLMVGFPSGRWGSNSSHDLACAQVVTLSTVRNKYTPQTHPNLKTGMKYSIEEEARIRKNFNRVTAVRLNAFGLQRVNAHLQQQRRSLLPSALAVSAGQEIESTADDIVSAPSSASILDYNAASVSDLVGASLPLAVDNSLLQWFPPIRDQGSLGSCVAFAAGYYQLSYMIAREKGIAINNADNSTKYSPKFIYNMINGGGDGGSYTVDAYILMLQHGAAVWSLVPYDSNYLSWVTDATTWREALKARANTAVYIDNVGTNEGMLLVKKLLNNGYILTAGTYAYSWVLTPVRDNPATTDDNSYIGQEAIYWQNGLDGGHFITIVGYNDNLWIDINGNLTVDANELGAFKIANSWGTSWGNSGFVWASYDALRPISQVSGGPSAGRQTLFTSQQAFAMTVRSGGTYVPKLVGKFTLNHAKRQHIGVTLAIANAGAAYSTRTEWYPGALYHQGGDYAFNGTTTALNGDFLFDFTDLLPATTTAKDFYLILEDNTTGSALQLSSFTLLNPDSMAVLSSATGLPLSIDNNSNYSKITYTFAGTNTPPVASGTALPSSGEPPLVVDFVGTDSYDPDGNVVAYDWDFGDGSVHATNPIVQHTYAAEGNYVARLKVTDNNGAQTTSAAIPVTVADVISEYTITVSAGANGSISPGTTTVPAGSSPTFAITPNSGYQVQAVLVDGNSQGSITSYTFPNISGNHTLSASFSLIPVVPPVVSISANPATIYTGESTTLTWSATDATACTASGGWTGSRATTGTATLTPAQTETYTLTCTGAGGSGENSTTVTVQPLTYTLTVTQGNNGTISPGTLTLDAGADQVFTITPDSGYQIQDVLVDGVSRGAVSEYAFINVRANRSITASFSLIPLTPPEIVLTVDPSTIIAGDFATLTWSTTDATACTASGDWSGARNVAGSEVVSPAAAATYTLSCTGPDGSDNASVSVTVQPKTYVLTATAGSNGDISPATLTVNAGTDQTFTMSPHSGYQIADVLVDAVSVGTSPTHTFTNVQANHTIAVSFSLIPPPAPVLTFTATPATIIAGDSTTLNWSATDATACTASGSWTGTKDVGGAAIMTPAASATYTLVCTGPSGTDTETVTVTVNPRTYTLEVVQGNNGTITPGTVLVSGGSSQTFTMTPDADYLVQDVLVNGISVGPLTSYTFADVRVDSSITAVFSPIPPQLTFEASPVNILGGGSSVLTWSTNYATLCVASGEWAGFQPTSGTQGVTPAATAEYTLTCYGPGGSTVVSAGVTVGTVNYTVSVVQGAHGTIAPGTVTVVDGATQIFTITPDSLYRIGSVIADGIPEGSANQYTFTDIQSNHTLTATFVPLPPTVTLTATPEGITGGGSSTLSWTTTNANACGASGAWEGAKAVSGTQVVSPAVTSSYTLTCNGDGGAGADMVTVTVTPATHTLTVTQSANGTISPDTTAVTAGTDKTFAMTPQAGYQVQDVLVDGVSFGAVDSYTFTNVQADHTITASFSLIPVPAPVITISGAPATISVGQSSILTWSTLYANSCTASGDWSGSKATAGTQTVTPSAAGTANYTLTCTGYSTSSAETFALTVNIPVYNLTVTQGANGVIAPGTTALAAGNEQIFTITPDSGYQTTDVLVDALSQGAIPSFTFTNVQEDHQISALFSAIVIPAPEVSFSASPATVVTGDVTTLSWASTSATACTAGGDWSGAKAVAGSQAVTVTQNSTYTLACTGPGGTDTESQAVTVTPRMFSLTVTQGANGTIAPDTTSVAEGGTQAFTITPNEGYRIEDILVNGVSVGTDSPYTFTNVQANQTITATFIAIPATISFTANPVNVDPGESSSLTWDSTNTTSCAASGGWSGAKTVTGTEPVTPVNPITVYSLTCSGIGGTVSRDVTVSITFPVTPTVSGPGSIEPSGVQNIPQGGSVTFRLTPEAGQSVKYVLVDGKGVALTYDNGTWLFTLTDVQAAHAVEVVFGERVFFLRPLKRIAK